MEFVAPFRVPKQASCNARSHSTVVILCQQNQSQSLCIEPSLISCLFQNCSVVAHEQGRHAFKHTHLDLHHIATKDNDNRAERTTNHCCCTITIALERVPPQDRNHTTTTTQSAREKQGGLSTEIDATHCIPLPKKALSQTKCFRPLSDTIVFVLQLRQYSTTLLRV